MFSQTLKMMKQMKYIIFRENNIKIKSQYRLYIMRTVNNQHYAKYRDKQILNKRKIYYEYKYRLLLIKKIGTFMDKFIGYIFSFTKSLMYFVFFFKRYFS